MPSRGQHVVTIALHPPSTGKSVNIDAGHPALAKSNMAGIYISAVASGAAHPAYDFELSFRWEDVSVDTFDLFVEWVKTFGTRNHEGFPGGVIFQPMCNDPLTEVKLSAEEQVKIEKYSAKSISAVFHEWTTKYADMKGEVAAVPKKVGYALMASSINYKIRKPDHNFQVPRHSPHMERILLSIAELQALAWKEKLPMLATQCHRELFYHLCAFLPIPGRLGDVIPAFKFHLKLHEPDENDNRIIIIWLAFHLEEVLEDERLVSMLSEFDLMKRVVSLSMEVDRVCDKQLAELVEEREQLVQANKELKYKHPLW